MPAAIMAIEEAVAQEEARQSQADETEAAWSLLETMKSDHAAAKDIVCGVETTSRSDATLVSDEIDLESKPCRPLGTRARIRIQR